MAGEYAASKGFPILDPTQDIRLGPDQINAIFDAIALKLFSPWNQAVNTTQGIATTANINANGKIITNELACNVNAFVGGQLSVNSGINTNGTVLANGVLVNDASGQINVAAVINNLKSRVAALEAK